MSTIADRYRKHADAFERRIAAARPGQWTSPSPCEKWTARDVVDHIIMMHGAMLRPVGRELSPAPSDVLGAFQAARADVEALLGDPAAATTESPTPSGPMTAEDHVDKVLIDDLILHGWDLAKALGQDATIDQAEVERLWTTNTAIPAEMMAKFRTPGAFGPGIEVLGPEVPVATDAPLQDRLLGFIGRDPHWTHR
ncbi:TIGR03086 family protein [Kibdelosporangium aridum]|uniref:TIGR03086 family protein n=1 Tax=Kibdelosporangium aridum TaxID=2030 RepID=A0A428YZV0_KIBAR|nr:TIGR03086 family metal-binding protein [Kibdelosporangium aridum]RSM77263.1 TIGR03086 family protein [Kibdelosporangium aridum]